jgi:hypothetical protein
MLQPEMQRAKLPEVPCEIDRERATDTEPYRACKPADRGTYAQRYSQAYCDVDEGNAARVHQRGRAEKR